MNAKHSFTKAIACVLALVMAFGALASLKGASLFAVIAEARSASAASKAGGSDEGVVLDKTAVLQPDGTYTIELSAYLKGMVIDEAVPVDVILLLDQSYSMANEGELFGTAYNCYHQTAITQAAKGLISSIAESASESADHRMAIAAYGCENTLIAQYFPYYAGGINKYPYAGSELYVGASRYRYNGSGSYFNYDPSTYISENYPGTITATGIDHYDNGANGGYPADSAQAHYGEAMLDVRTQKEALIASIDAYNPNPDDQAERGGTAMHVGLRMAEGIMDAYKPDPNTHANMYFKPDPSMQAYSFIEDGQATYWFFIPDENGANYAYVEDPTAAEAAERAVTAYPHHDGADAAFYAAENGPDYNLSSFGYYTYCKTATKYSLVRGNWIKGEWIENEHTVVDGVKVYGTWKNREKVVIIFTDGYVGDTAFRPDWANMCMQSAARIKDGTYGAAATVYTVGLIWDEPEELIHDYLDVAWNGDTDDGVYKHYIHYASYGRQYFNTGEFFPNHFFADPHEELLKKFLGALSSNYASNAQGEYPTTAVSYNAYGSSPTLAVYNNESHRAANLKPAYDDGGLYIDNYFIDAHNTLSDPNTADSQNINRLVEAFSLIGREVVAVDDSNQSGGSSVLPADAVLRDYLSEHFIMPEGFSAANVGVEVEDCIAIENESYRFGNRRDLFTDEQFAQNVSVNTQDRSVSVAGFELAACAKVGGGVQGNRLTVTITGVEAKKETAGESIPTNDPDRTGIYSGGDDDEPRFKFPLPTVDIREKYVVYDFCRPMEESELQHFFGSNGDVLDLLALGECYKKQEASAYQTEYVKLDERNAPLYVVKKHGGNGVRFEIKHISYSDFEAGALLKCDPDKNGGVEYEWCRLTFLPATNVHYEESMLRYSDGSRNTAIGSDYGHWMELGGDGCSWSLGGAGSTAERQSTANVRYGYEESYDKYGNSGESDSNGTAAHVVVDSAYAQQVKAGEKQWPTAYFRYTGTGLDVISRSGADTGVIALDVVPHGAARNYRQGVRNKDYAHLIVDTYYRDAGDGGAVILHQIPVLRIVDMNWGDYDVYITAVYDKLFDHLPRPKLGAEDGENALTQLKLIGLADVDYELVCAASDGAQGEAEPAKAPEYGCFDVYLDAIRVYEPRGKTGMSATDERAYREAKEYNPTYRQIRDILLDPEQYADGNVNVNGVLYIDGQGGIVDVSKYREHGPNNETYLAPAEKHEDGTTTERAFAFTVKDWNNESSRLHISAKAPYGKVHMYVNGEYAAAVVSATEMYYDVTDIIRRTNGILGDANGHVVIAAYLDPDEPDPTPAPTDAPTLAPEESAAPQPSEAPYAAPDPETHRVLSLVNIKFIPDENAAAPNDPTPSANKARVKFTVNGNPNMQLLISGDLTTGTIPDAPTSQYAYCTSEHNAIGADNISYMLPGPAKDDVYEDYIAHGEIEVDAGTYRFGVFAKAGTAWLMFSGCVAELTLMADDTLHVSFSPEAGFSFEHSSAANESLRFAIVTRDTLLFAEAILAGVPGDANHDRVVNLMDALRIMRYALGSDDGLDLYERYCADFNKDGRIDLLDAIAVMRASL